MTPRIIDQELEGAELGIAVVAARFNSYMTDQMLEIALKRLHRRAVPDDVPDENIIVARTAGSFELSLTARRLAERGDVDAVICIGVVIRGDTDHYEHIARAATDGIARAGDDSGKPIIFGVLTTDDTDQAISRITQANDYADTAVEMANTFRQIHNLR